MTTRDSAPVPPEDLIAYIDGEAAPEIARRIAADPRHLAEARGYARAQEALRQRLAEISMIDFSKIPHGKAGLGSTVVVLDTKRDEEVTYNLVTTEEADAANGKISRSTSRCRGL